MWQFNEFLRQTPKVKSDSGTAFPSVAIILPLRGAEDSLKQTLLALSGQRYPHYTIHIVVDSDDDPAWPIVRSHIMTMAQPNMVFANTLLSPSPDRSLKLSAQLQALATLDSDCKIVMFIDADATPHQDWLQDMVAPFVDPTIGLTTGLRWYWPIEPTIGDLARHAINACAVPIMYRFNIPWGGSLAIRKSALDAAAIPTVWARSFGEDTSCYGPLVANGWRMKTVPTATLFNRETIGIRGCFQFFTRQFLSVRLHQTNRQAIFVINSLAFVALGMAFLALPLGCFTSEPWLFASGALIITLYIAGMVIGVRCAERHLPRPPSATDRDWPMPLHYQIASIFPALTVAVIALLASLCAKTVIWRGITYDLTSYGSIRMREYHPHRTQPPDRHSLL